MWECAKTSGSGFLPCMLLVGGHLLACWGLYMPPIELCPAPFFCPFLEPSPSVAALLSFRACCQQDRRAGFKPSALWLQEVEVMLGTPHWSLVGATGASGSYFLASLKLAFL